MTALLALACLALVAAAVAWIASVSRRTEFPMEKALLPGNIPSDAVRQGRIRMAGRTYTATVVRSEDPPSSYDLPSTRVHLMAPELAIRIGGHTLWVWRDKEDLWGTPSTMFGLRGGWYSVVPTAGGERVSVRRYEGDLGAVMVSYGGRTAGNGIANGSLHNGDGARLILLTRDITDLKGMDERLVVPVGDYAADVMGIVAGPYYLVVTRGDNWSRHDGCTESDHFLKVRKDKPFILSIESSGEIVFSGYKAKSVYRPGDTVSVSCYLATPTIWVRGISTRSGMLNPKVRILDSKGKVLGEGVSPYKYDWTVPGNFAPRGGREILKVTATWDTRQLFGVVTGTKEIVVESRETGSTK